MNVKQYDNKVNTKPLEYYMALKYPIEVIELEADTRQGYFCCIPQLGSASVNGIGDTLEEALIDMNDRKKEFFETIIENNIDVPEPEEYKEGRDNIQLTILLNKDIFYNIFATMYKSNISINDLITGVITKHFKFKEDLIAERKKESKYSLELAK